ncbi:MAG: leader peptidase (prepilin peptidase)/N-methyltransferase, partial [Lysobacterales bacterium]
MTEELCISIFIFLFGTIIGSFLNVCIVRMPKEESVIKPRSHCPSCKKLVAWYDNIPLFSYFILSGKCRHCSAKFSMRYFCVEFVTGLIYFVFYKYYGLSLLLVPYLFMMSCFIVAVLVDFEHRIIPDEISVGGMCFGILFSLFIPEMHGIIPEASQWWLGQFKSVGWSLVGVLAGGGSIYMMGVLGDVFFKKETMGGGDV